MSRPLSRPQATAARIQARADKGRAWQEIQELWEQGEKARDEYEAYPIITRSFDCASCTGFAYGQGGTCFDCVKEGVVGRTQGAQVREDIKRAERVRKWSE